MKRIPILEVHFTNRKELQLDLNFWHLDAERSKTGTIVFFNDAGEMFSLVANNIDFMTTYIKDIPEIGDPKPLRRRLDPR